MFIEHCSMRSMSVNSQNKAEMFNKTFKSRVGAKFEVLGAFTQKKVLAFVSISWENNVANQ